MNLILWRHAEAMDGQPDIKRMLSAKGLQQASDMAEWLRSRLPANTRVIASPAERAKQTASALTDSFEIEQSISPGASADALLAALGWPNPADNVVIVGHQPTLGEAAALLLCGRRLPWSIKTGAIWWFDIQAREKESRIALLAVMAPRLL